METSIKLLFSITFEWIFMANKYVLFNKQNVYCCAKHTLIDVLKQKVCQKCLLEFKKQKARNSYTQ